MEVMKTDMYAGMVLVVLVAAAMFGGYYALRDTAPRTDSALLEEENNTTGENNTTVVVHVCWDNATMAWSGETLAAPTNNTTDWDGDNISDEDEALFETDPCHYDTDNDTLTDFIEVFSTMTNASDNDTDNDTLTDAVDPNPLNASWDQDGDGVLDQHDIDMWTDVMVTAQVTYNWTGGTQVQVLLAINGTDHVNNTFLFVLELFYNGSGQQDFTYDWPDASETIPTNYTMEELSHGVVYDIKQLSRAGYKWSHDHMVLELRFV